MEKSLKLTELNKENLKIRLNGGKSSQEREKMEKEFLYVGHYIDTEGNHILKIGTTNNLERRRKEHTRNYRRSSNYKLPLGAEFEYDWTLPLSKYNTLRYEDKNRTRWQEMEIGDFVRNDRFNCGDSFPSTIEVKIRKTYVIPLN